MGSRWWNRVYFIKVFFLCQNCVNKTRDEAPSASWRNGLYRRVTQCWDVHCETDGTVLLAVYFKSNRDEAPGASWEKWTALIYSGYAALNMHILKPTARRCVSCVSKVFVTKLPSLRGEMVYMGVYWRRSAEMRILKQTAWHCVLYVSKLFVTKLPSLRGEMVYMGVYWRRSAEMHIFKQTAWHCVLYVSKLFVTKLPVLSGRGSSYLMKWWYNKSFETVGHLMDFRCRRMFQNCIHVAPGVPWRSVE